MDYIATTRDKVRTVMKITKSTSGQQQILEIGEVRAIYTRIFGELPKGLSKHLAALKESGEVLSPNRGCFVWRTGEEIKPAAPRLLEPTELPTRGVPRTYEVPLDHDGLRQLRVARMIYTASFARGPQKVLE